MIYDNLGSEISDFLLQRLAITGNEKFNVGKVYIF